MTQAEPVSVIIPVYNCERYLAEAVQSARAQSYQPIEIIVVDDGSTDGSANVARQFLQAGGSPPLRFESLPHGGVSVARNRGVELAQGEYLAFLDSDDLWLPQKLEHQVAALAADPTLDLCFGLVDEFDGAAAGAETPAHTRTPGQGMPGYIPSTLLVRRESFLRAGFFEPEWQIAQFFEWYVRSQERGLRSVMLNDVVARRRLHGANLGIYQQDRQVEYVRIAKAMLDRRRKAAEGRENG